MTTQFPHGEVVTLPQGGALPQKGLCITPEQAALIAKLPLQRKWEPCREVFRSRLSWRSEVFVQPEIVGWSAHYLAFVTAVPEEEGACVAVKSRGCVVVFPTKELAMRAAECCL